MRVAACTFDLGIFALGCVSTVVLIAPISHAAIPDGAAPSQAKNEAVAAELKIVQGTWQLLSSMTDGKAMPDEQVKQIRVLIDGDHHTVTFDGKVIADKVKFTIDPTTTPKSTEDTL